MHIRPAGDDDRAAIAALQAASWKDAYRGLLTDSYFENDVASDLLAHWQAVALRCQDVVLVAEEGGTAAGFIAVWCDPDPYIDNLHVLPDWRAKGTGRRLMQAAAARLIALGHTTAYLWVLEDNPRAFRFYEGLGGRRAERAGKEIFGQVLPSWKITWPDISVIAAPAEDSGA